MVLKQCVLSYDISGLPDSIILTEAKCSKGAQQVLCLVHHCAVLFTFRVNVNGEPVLMLDALFYCTDRSPVSWEDPDSV